MVQAGDRRDAELARRAAGRTDRHSWPRPPAGGARYRANEWTDSWGCSSAGRAPAWHAGGRGFESPQLHHPSVKSVVVPRMISPLRPDARGLLIPGLPEQVTGSGHRDRRERRAHRRPGTVGAGRCARPAPPTPGRWRASSPTSAPRAAGWSLRRAPSASRGGVLHRRDDPRPATAWPDRGRGGRRRGRQRAGQPRAQRDQRPYRGPLDCVARWMARRRRRHRPDARGAGLGAGAGLAKIALGVFPDNERAIAVYEHVGFEREGLRRMPVSRRGRRLPRRAADGLVPRRGGAPTAQARGWRAMTPTSRRADARSTPGQREYDRSGPGTPSSSSRGSVRRLRLSEHPHVVDLGAGTGRASLAMAELGWRVTAVEPGKRMLDQLRTNAANAGCSCSTVQANGGGDRPGPRHRRPGTAARRSIGSTRMPRWRRWLVSCAWRRRRPVLERARRGALRRSWRSTSACSASASARRRYRPVLQAGRESGRDRTRTAIEAATGFEARSSWSRWRTEVADDRLERFIGMAFTAVRPRRPAAGGAGPLPASSWVASWAGTAIRMRRHSTVPYRIDLWIARRRGS